MSKKIKSLICVLFAMMLIAGATIPASAAVSADDDELAMEITNIVEDRYNFGETEIFQGVRVSIEYENNLGESLGLTDTEIVVTTTDDKDYYGDWNDYVIGKGCGTVTCSFDSDFLVDSIDTITITTLKRDETGFSSANDIVLYEGGEIVENVVVDFETNAAAVTAVGATGIIAFIITIIGGLITMLGPVIILLIFALGMLLFAGIVVVVIIALVKHNKKNKQTNTTYTPVTGESNGDDGGFAPPPGM